jgi:two-component system nitrate/nitrite sensor histidine kinase NarX
MRAFSTLPQIGLPQEIAVSSVEMRICDNGLGFDPGELTAPGHYGLGMMHERAEAVDAQLVVTSQPGHGTEVRLYWPKTAGTESL